MKWHDARRVGELIGIARANGRLLNGEGRNEATSSWRPSHRASISLVISAANLLRVTRHYI